MPERNAGLASDATNSAPSRSRVIHKVLEDVAAEHSGRIAVSYLGRETTYRELDVQASSLAWRLTELSVRPGDIVAVILPHSTELVVAFLAILKCGAAYLPLDPANPPQRNTEFMRAANVNVLIAAEQLDAAYSQIRNVLLTSDFAAARGFVESFDSRCDDKAYVMYTSGSTGSPKGVVIPHRAIARLVLNPTTHRLSATTAFCNWHRRHSMPRRSRSGVLCSMERHSFPIPAGRWIPTV